MRMMSKEKKRVTKRRGKRKRGEKRKVTRRNMTRRKVKGKAKRRVTGSWPKQTVVAIESSSFL